MCEYHLDEMEMAISRKVRVALIPQSVPSTRDCRQDRYRFWPLYKSGKVVRVSANRGLSCIRYREDGKAKLSRGEMWRDPFPGEELCGGIRVFPFVRAARSRVLHRILFARGPGNRSRRVGFALAG